MNRARGRRGREINPALRIRDFYSFGLQVLNEINFARMHPDEFVQKLEELNDTINNDNCLYIDGVPFLYTNLKESLVDAIQFLSKQKPLPGLIYNKTITQACDFLLDELIIHDGLDNDESNKYSLENRLSKFGEPLGESYELIDYGMFDPEFIVINFILCDGDNQKYERKVIFNPNIKFLGIAASILPSDKICTVINFCEEFYEKYESIPLDVQMKYKKSSPQYTTKTVKSYPNKIEQGNQNLKNEKDEEKEYLDNLDNLTNDYNIKRRNSGNIFNMKKDQYIQRRDSIKKQKEEKKKEKQNDLQQRGGTINIQPKVMKTKNTEPKKELIEDFGDEDDEEFRDDRMVIRRKKTVHEPKGMEVIEEEKSENEEPFDREFKIETPLKKENNYIPPKNIEKISNFSENKNKKPNSNLKNSTTETKYLGDKKITTTTTTETADDGNKKTITTTITEEIGHEIPRFRNKVVKDIPFKSYGRKMYQNPKDEFDIEKEMRELEKDFDKEFGHLNLKSPIKPVFESTDDMFEKEDDIDIPDGAISIEVKQKTITDSKGKPVLVVHKTIHYDNGEIKTIIEKKNIVKK